MWIWDFLTSYWHFIVPGGGVVIALAIAAWFFRDWRLAAIAGVIVTAALAVAKAFAEGGAAARERQELATKRAVDKVKKVKDEVAEMSDDEVKKELLEWSRK